MDAAKKKPSLGAVVVEIGSAKKPAKDDDDAYAAAVDELAEVMGVSEEKLDAFREAFQAAVMSCK
jgi:hypothetical protein